MTGDVLNPFLNLWRDVNLIRSHSCQFCPYFYELVSVFAFLSHCVIFSLASVIFLKNRRG